MSHIAEVFSGLAKQDRCALISYITAGDPSPDHTLDLMQMLVAAGADMIELGVPFSDPMADGPVIQAACERALKFNTSLHDVINIVKRFRKYNPTTPVILMGYLNPIERMGYQMFARNAKNAGIDGVLTVDMPPEESHDLVASLQQQSLDPVYLLSPTSTKQRIRKIADAASGFLYYVSLKGVTGAANLDVEAVRQKLAQIRQQTQLPIGVGFGIHDACSAASIAEFSDAVVVGSAIVRIIESNQGNFQNMQKQIGDLLLSMRKSIDATRQTSRVHVG